MKILCCLHIIASRRFSVAFCAFSLMLLSACTHVPPAPAISTGQPQVEIPPATDTHAPPIPREFRAVWVASVGNIDWPSRKNLTVAQQKKEILAILDMAARLQLNAIVLQIRPAADALYASELEPWSEYLTGEQGKAPAPYYDPLAMWVEEAHRRGMELHAWFNPFRAKTTLKKSSLAKNHVSQRYPGAVKTYGDMLWMDPAEPQIVQHSLQVIQDVVRRYDIDGVHLDDYFYPYPISVSGKEVDFPDEASWQRYLQNGGTAKRADWRRQNVNQFIQTLYHSVHEIKPWIKIGISPFGIGRPDRLPQGIAGFSQYDQLYADVELWLEHGWLDYLSPQLYWPIEQSAQAFPVLLSYWLRQNTLQRYIWPGLHTNRLEMAEPGWPLTEIEQQIQLTRQDPYTHGHLHFSASSLMRNQRNLQASLRQDVYQQAALVPAMPWLSNEVPAQPELQFDALACTLHIQAQSDVSRYAVWKHTTNGWKFSVVSAQQADISLSIDASDGELSDIEISAVNRYGNLSPAHHFSVPH